MTGLQVSEHVFRGSGCVHVTQTGGPNSPPTHTGMRTWLNQSFVAKAERVTVQV